MVEFWRFDDATRTVFHHAPDGTVIDSRPYTAEEIAAADAGAATATQFANKSSLELHLEEDLAAMQVIKDTPNSTINASPASYIKEVAVAVRRLIKMTLEDFSEAE